MKLSCVIPTYRFGGMDCLLGSLKNQTLSKSEWELILPDDLYDFRWKEVKEYAEKLDVPLVHFKPPKSDKPFACGHAINWGLRHAEGDYVMIGQDFLWLEPDCFERHLKIQKPERRVVVGYMPHYVAPPLSNLEGKLTVFDRIHEEKPTVMELPDVRWTNVVSAPDLGEDYGRFEHHWYLTYYSVVPNATFPIQALIVLNGYDERLDIGHGFNDDNLCFRLSRFLNCEFILDKKNYMYHITHPWSRKEQHKEQANTHYNILNSILQGFMGVKAWNGYDLIQERCRVRYEKWVKEEGEMESPPREETYAHPSQQARLSLIRKLCEEMESVLELGCSDGYVLRNVAPKNARLAGIDINRKVIEENRRVHPEVKWFYGDITKGLPFPDDSFDVVLETEVLEHLPYEAVMNVIISGLKVAKKRLIITIPQATTQNYNRKWVESPHHRWALTLDRLYVFTLNFIPRFWSSFKPDFTLDRIQYWLDSDFCYFKIDKVKGVKEEDEVTKRAKMLYEAKAKEAEELKKKKFESSYQTQWRT